MISNRGSNLVGDSSQVDWLYCHCTHWNVTLPGWCLNYKLVVILVWTGFEPRNWEGKFVKDIIKLQVLKKYYMIISLHCYSGCTSVCRELVNPCTYPSWQYVYLNEVPLYFPKCSHKMHAELDFIKTKTNTHQNRKIT